MDPAKGIFANAVLGTEDGKRTAEKLWFSQKRCLKSTENCVERTDLPSFRKLGRINKIAKPCANLSRLCAFTFRVLHESLQILTWEILVAAHVYFYNPLQDYKTGTTVQDIFQPTAS